MKTRKKPSNVGPIDDSLTNDTHELWARLGQYCYAFGQGAGSVRVKRRVMYRLIRYYEPAIKDSIADDKKAWELRGSVVLDLMAAIGRVAASIATADGRMAIDVKDFRKAVKRVVKNLPTMMRGPDCPIGNP